MEPLPGLPSAPDHEAIRDRARDLALGHDSLFEQAEQIRQVRRDQAQHLVEVGHFFAARQRGVQHACQRHRREHQQHVLEEDDLLERSIAR